MSKGSSGFWREGRWVILLVVLGVLLPCVWWGQRLQQPRTAPIGNGKDPTTYGFPLDQAAVDVSTLVGAGIARDGIPTLVNPGSIATAHIPRLGRRFLLPSDPVVGVVAGGEAKAYPLRVLAFHEVVNDAVGGQPILVVHQPLCGFTAVFSRQSPSGPPVFGVSGLVWNSCGVLYRRHQPQEGLYLPLLGKAITGPAAARGETLSLFPFLLTTWKRWLQHHPQTTVVQPHMAHLSQYRRDPYSSYLGSELLRFPVRPLLPSQAPFRPKSQLLVLWPYDDPVVIPLERIAQGQVAQVMLRGARLGITGLSERLAELVPIHGQPPPFVSVFAFPWYAAHPQVDPSTWGLPNSSRQ